MVCSLLAALAFQPDPEMLRVLYQEALAKRAREYGETDPRTARAAEDLGLFLESLGDRKGAGEALLKALEFAEKAYGRDAPRTLAVAAELAGSSSPADAAPLWRRAMDSPDLSVAAKSLAALGDAAEAAGDRIGATRFYRQALAKEELADRKDSERLAVRLNALALVVPPREGVVLLRRALEINRRRWGVQHPETATIGANLSGLLLATGSIREAVRVGNEALAAFDATLGGDHPRTAAAASNLADAWRAQGNRGAAEKLYRRALAIDERAYGPDHPETLGDVRNLADFLRDCGRAEEAAQLELRLRDVRW